jgi:hypothetical protein
MITPSYSPTATERVLPRLALDFTTGTLDARVAVARASNTATAVNSSGFIATVNANLPRFDYDPLTLACKGLLIEEARTNGFTYSEDFRDTAAAGATRPWVYSNASVSANTITAPDNTLTADTIIENTATNSHGVFQPFTTTSGTPTTLSFYAKAKERTQVASIGGGGGYGTAITVIYDLVGLTAFVGTGTATATITDAGNGWRRCTWTATPTASNPTNHFIQLASGGANVYTGDGTSGAYVWGAQIELGAFATSYIPTVATSLTRNADVVTMTGTNFSDWYNASEGTFSVRSDVYVNNTAPARCTLLINKVGTGNMQFKVTRPNTRTGVTVIDDAGAVAADLSGNILATNTFTTVVGAYKDSSFAFADGGSAASTDTSGNIPTGLTQMYIGSDGTTALQNGHVSKIYYWPQRLTDAEVQAFSK